MDSSEEVYSKVTAHYSSQASGTSAPYATSVAKSFGYTEEELSSAPDGSNLGLSCGNPLAIASLRQGETVIDLGCGTGFDVFQAADRLGPSGRALGVDMNGKMLAKANDIKGKTGIANVEFVEARITDMHMLQDGTADVILSNCVINLVPHAEKHLVFREAYRLLKPGGRLAVSDILARKELPEKLRNDMAMYVGCVAGASMVEEYEGWMKETGFGSVVIKDAGGDMNVYLDTQDDGSRKERCCGARSGEDTEYMGPEVNDLNEWAGEVSLECAFVRRWLTLR